MFRTDESELRQKNEEIRAGVESSRQKSAFRKSRKMKRPSFWIVLITFFKKL